MLLVFASRFTTSFDNKLACVTQECFVHEFAKQNAVFRRRDPYFLEKHHGTHAGKTLLNKNE